MAVPYIILLDDNPTDRTMAERIVREALGACEFALPNGPVEWETRLREREPDLVITDFQIGWTDGLAVLRQVKLQWADCPVVMFTGTGDESTAVEGMKLGLADYVMKDEAHCLALGAAAAAASARGRQRRELREAEATKAELERRLRHSQKMEAFSLLASGVAHDFNNIISAILGFSDLILLTEECPSGVREQVQQINDAGKRAANLTRQLLTFSRRQALQRRALHLNDVMPSLGKMLQRIVGDHITLRFHLAGPGLPAVMADVNMIEQVVVNLAVNARDAMPGGGELRISTELARDDPGKAAAHGAGPGPFVALSVGDTGTGIEAAVLSRLFEPFFTTKAPGKGTGLGLTTVQNILQQHGGWVEVESELGKGSVFRCYFPAASLSATPAPAARAPSLQTGGGETILVVEDDASVRELVVNVLARRQYRVLSADSAASAVKVWAQHGDSVSLLLTDIVMPGGVSGGELASRLKHLRPKLKVLYMSGYAQGVAGAEFAREDARRLIQKPFTIDQLVLSVRTRLTEAEG